MMQECNGFHLLLAHKKILSWHPVQAIAAAVCFVHANQLRHAISSSCSVLGSLWVCWAWTLFTCTAAFTRV